MNKTFWDLLYESVIFQGLLTLMIAGTLCYCVAARIQPPEWLVNGFFTILAFFFGSKVGQASVKANQNRSVKTGE